MPNNKVQFLLAVYFLSITIVAVISSNPLKTSGVRARLEKQTCVCGKYCTVKTCYVKLISRDNAVTTVIINNQAELTNVKVTFKSYFKFSNNEFRPFMMNGEVDVCAVQEGYYSSPLFAYFENLVGNNSNLFKQKCPVPPGEYYFKDVDFQASHLPNVLPHGQYLLNISINAQNNELVINIRVYFYVINYGLQDLTIG